MLNPILNDDKTEITFLQKDEEEDNTTAAAVPDTITCDNLINVAGLYAPHISHKINNFPTKHIPKAHYAKGSYFSLEGKSPFQMLVLIHITYHMLFLSYLIYEVMLS